MSEITKIIINPLIYEILGLTEENRPSIYNCDSNSFVVVFTKTKNDIGNIYKIKFYKGSIELVICYNYEKMHGFENTLIKLNDVTTLDHLRSFKNLVDIYFRDYLIEKSTKDE